MSDISTEYTGHFSGCACPACSGGNNNVDPVQGENQDGYWGGQDNAPTTYGSASTMANQLVNGYWQNVGWSAHQWNHSAGTPTVTYSLSNEFTAGERASFTSAFSLWSQVANINFSLVTSGAQITVLEGDDGGAWAGNVSYNPANGNMNSGTVSIDTDVSGWDDLVTIGGYGVQTVLHEIGHILGLGHQGNYNGNVNYNDPSQVAYLNDNRQYSLMSYNNANLLGTDHWAQSGVWQYAATPMLYDIMAIQQIYGANMTTRATDTVYGFNSTAGVTQYNLSVSSAPFAIWDGSGTDTLDLSGYSTNQTITLVAGDFTSAGYMTNNIVIAYGAVIENAIGGSGSDSIYGNSANNILRGGLGNDTLYGSTGNDTLNGEGGSDTVNYSFNISAFIVGLVDSVTVTLNHIAGAWTDTVTNVENFIFGGTSYTLAQVQALAYDPETYTMYFRDAGGAKYYYESEDLGSDAVTGAELGMSSVSSYVATFNRTINDVTISIQNIVAFSSLNLTGLSGNDTFVVNGAHSNFAITFDGRDGDDVLTITGITGADTLYGGAGNDTISAGNGDDRLYGQDGNDILNGDNGNDTISAGAGDDTINGGANDDDLYGGDGNDTINGGTGNDRMFGDAGNDILNGNAGVDRIYGGAGDDTINGGDDNDVIAGDDGIDTIHGDNGNDTLYGNAGADFLYGDVGNDVIYGGLGNDTINGGDGIDYLYGEEGDDTINGDNGDDLLYGAEGNDTINGGVGNDAIYGGNGLDVINGNDGNDVIRGEAGNDTIHGNNGDDTIYADGDDDIVYGDAGIDTLYGGAGNDTLYGGTENDVISGDAGNDTLYGDEGNDTLYGGDGLDVINGGDGTDSIYGGNGHDTIYGGAGNDGLRGDAGNDIIYGDAGNDTIYGMDGNDTLYGGAGQDQIYGGSGADTFGFLLSGLDGTVDYIRDLNLAEGDRFDISNLLTGFTAGVSDIDNFLVFNAPDAGGVASMGVDRDGAGSAYSLVWVARVTTGGAVLNAQTLYDNGDIVV